MAKAGIRFSTKDEWNTPREVVDFFGPFDYDAATTGKQSLNFGIPFYDTIESNGLSTDWTGYARIWCNPPFTKKFEFLAKAVGAVRGSSSMVFFLLPAETITTKKFHEIVGGQPYRMWVPDGRIKFEAPEGGGVLPRFWLCRVGVRQAYCEFRNKALET